MALRAVIDHPKFSRLKHLLGLNKSETLGYLECLWHFAGRYTPRGDIGKYADEEIEAWLEYSGPRGKLIASLIECRWLDQDDTHRLLVHDWADHADGATKIAVKRAGSEIIPTPSLQCPNGVATVSPQCPDTVVIRAPRVPGPGPGPVPVPGAVPEPGPEPEKEREKQASGNSSRLPKKSARAMLKRLRSDDESQAGSNTRSADFQRISTFLDSPGPEAQAQASVGATSPEQVEDERLRKVQASLKAKASVELPPHADPVLASSHSPPPEPGDDFSEAGL